MENRSVPVPLRLQLKRLRAEESADPTKVCTPTRTPGKLPGPQGVRVGINVSSKFWKLLRETRGDGGEFWALGC